MIHEKEPKESFKWNSILDGKIQKSVFKIVGSAIEEFLEYSVKIPSHIAKAGFIIPFDILSMLLYEESEQLLKYSKEMDENNEEQREKKEEMQLKIFSIKMLSKIEFDKIAENFTNIFKNYESIYSFEKSGLIMIYRQPTKSILDIQEEEYLNELGYYCDDDEPQVDKYLCEKCRFSNHADFCDDCGREIDNNNIRDNFATYSYYEACRRCSKKIMEDEIETYLIENFECNMEINEFSFLYGAIRTHILNHQNFYQDAMFEDDLKESFESIINDWGAYNHLINFF